MARVHGRRDRTRHCGVRSESGTGADGPALGNHIDAGRGDPRIAEPEGARGRRPDKELLPGGIGGPRPRRPGRRRHRQGTLAARGYQAVRVAIARVLRPEQRAGRVGCLEDARVRGAVFPGKPAALRGLLRRAESAFHGHAKGGNLRALLELGVARDRLARIRASRALCRRLGVGVLGERLDGGPAGQHRTGLGAQAHGGSGGSGRGSRGAPRRWDVLGLGREAFDGLAAV